MLPTQLKYEDCLDFLLKDWACFKACYDRDLNSVESIAQTQWRSRQASIRLWPDTPCNH